jgi:hypothetical protein
MTTTESKKNPANNTIRVSPQLTEWARTVLRLRRDEEQTPVSKVLREATRVGMLFLLASCAEDDDGTYGGDITPRWLAAELRPYLASAAAHMVKAGEPMALIYGQPGSADGIRGGAAQRSGATGGEAVEPEPAPESEPEPEPPSTVSAARNRLNGQGVGLLDE